MKYQASLQTSKLVIISLPPHTESSCPGRWRRSLDVFDEGVVPVVAVQADVVGIDDGIINSYF